ncbi:MAG: osmosensitive channel histidine kinase, partial [Sporolactobacillus laevolacticus]|nr:osmosensitive channel histidine kinase [Sporolactobacillus laevolacticus]
MFINKDHSIENIDMRHFEINDHDLHKKQASIKRESTKIDRAQDQVGQEKKKILVCIGGSPFSKKLIYTARQMASDMDTQWMALYISKPVFFNYRPQNQNMIAENERLVDELGAEAYNVVGRRIADTIISFAKQHHIGHIIIGQPGSSFIFGRLGGMTVNRVIQKSGNITVHVIPGVSEEKSNRRTMRIGTQQSATSYLILTAIIALMTLFLKGSFIQFDQVNISLLFLLPVLLGAALWGIGPGLYAAAMGVLSFDFFFVPPFQSLSVVDLRYISSFVIFLIVAFLTAGLSSGLKQQLQIAQQNERITSILYALSRKITIMDELDQTLQSIVQKISETIGYQVTIYLPDEKGKLKNAVSSFSVQENEERERLIAEWTY